MARHHFSSKKRVESIVITHLFSHPATQKKAFLQESSCITVITVITIIIIEEIVSIQIGKDYEYKAAQHRATAMSDWTNTSCKWQDIDMQRVDTFTHIHPHLPIPHTHTHTPMITYPVSVQTISINLPPRKSLYGMCHTISFRQLASNKMIPLYHKHQRRTSSMLYTYSFIHEKASSHIAYKIFSLYIISCVSVPHTPLPESQKIHSSALGTNKNQSLPVSRTTATCHRICYRLYTRKPQ